MNRLKKTDYIIVAVLLALVVLIVIMVTRSNSATKRGVSAPAQTSAAGTPRTLTYSDYNGKTIGIRNSSNFEPITLEKFPDSKYLYFENDSDLIQALQSNKIDAFLDDEPVAAMIHIEQPDVNYLKEPIVKDDYYFGFPKDTERSNKLRTEFNELLAELKSSGELDKMKEKWLGKDENAKTYDDSGLTGKNGEITVAVVPENVPFAYTANNELQGYVVELVTMLARRGGYSIRFEQANISSCLAGLTSGKYDIFAGSLSYTEERAQSIDYSDVIYNGGVMLVARTEDIGSGETASSDAANVSEPSYTEFNGRRMGIKVGSSCEPVTLKYFPDSEYSYYENDSDIIMAIRNEKIDGFLTDEPVAAMIHAEHPDVNYLQKVIMDDDYYFGFQKDNERSNKLRSEFNELIAELRSNGELDKMKSKWLGSDESAKTYDDSGLTGENGTIVVAVLPDYPPFSYTSNNKLSGYAVELTTIFARRYGYSISYEQTPVSGCLTGLTAGKYDFIASSLSYTEERAQNIDYSDVIYNGGIVLLARSSDIEAQTADTPQTVEDRSISYYAANGTFGVITGSLYETMVCERYPDVNILQFNSQPDLAIALSEGKIDAFIVPKTTAEDFIAADNSLTYLNEIFMEIPYGFAFQKSDGENKLRDQMNEYLAKIHADGTYDEIVDTWFGSDESKKTVDLTGLDSAETILRYVTTSTMQPYTYIKDGQNAGLEVDLIARFCREYGYGLRIDNADFAGIIPAIASGTYDIASGNIMITEERAQSVDFSDIYFTGKAVTVVRKESTAAAPAASGAETSYTEFNGKTAGVITGSMHDDIIRDNLSDCSMLEFKSYSDMTAALLSGKIDFFLMGGESVEQLMAENNELGYIKEPLDHLYCGAMFPKTEKGDKIRAQLDEYITKIYADGTRDEIYDFWSSPDVGSANVDTSGLTGENGTLILATCGEEMPISYVANGGIAGTDPDIAVRFCREYGYDIDIRIVDFGGIISGLKTGLYDFAMNDAVITEERKESVNFSVPYNKGPIHIVARKADIAASSADSSKRNETTVEAEQSFFGSIKESFNKNFIREDRYKLILEGIGTTCIITALSVAFGSLLAFLICLFRRADSVLSGMICDLYVKLLQGTPMVVLLMILYYVILGKSGIAAMWVAVIGFSLNFGAYVSEILRSGIESVDGGQREAALALGFSEKQSFFRFIFPQAAVRQLPVYRGEIISLLKNTSIVGYIAIQDLTKMSDIIRSRTYEAFFPLIVTAVIYFILAWIISLVLKFILKKTDPRSKKRGVKGVELK